MLSSPIAINAANASSEPLNRQLGALDMTEQWWRDRYVEIARLGYALRPRYQPNWQPSWHKSGKDFYAVEDGQPTKVRVAAITFLSSVYVGDSRWKQWTRPACETTFKLC
jgi:hypothetical protein